MYYDRGAFACSKLSGVGIVFSALFAFGSKNTFAGIPDGSVRVTSLDFSQRKITDYSSAKFPVIGGVFLFFVKFATKTFSVFQMNDRK